MRVAPTCIALALLSSLLLANDKFSRRHLTVEAGLSENHVYSIHQDARGYMWFATRGGINRYDGFHCEEIRDSMLSSVASSPVLDVSRIPNTFWISTPGQGFWLLDCLLQTATPYRQLFDSPGNTNTLTSTTLETLFHDDGDTLWIGTTRGLNSYALSNKQVCHYGMAGQPDPHDYLVLSIHKDLNSNVWIGTSTGLYRVDRTSKMLQRLHAAKIADSVTSIVETATGDLWIGTCNSGAFLLDNSGAIRRRILEDEDIFDVFIDDSDSWFGTASGKLFSERSGHISEVLYDDAATRRFPVTDIFRDRSGTLWVGTAGDGVWMLNSNDFIAKSIPLLSQDIVSGTVWSIAEDHRGRIWLGTGSGLAELHPQQGIIPVRDFPSGYPVRAIAERDGELWAGLLEYGVVRWNPDSRKSKRFSKMVVPSGVKPTNLVYALMVDTRKRVWVGTNGENFASLDEQREMFTSYLPGKGIGWTLALKEHPAGIIWAGTWSGGLIGFDTRTNTFIHLPSDEEVRSIEPSNRVLVVHQSKNDSGTFWLGTHGAGLWRFDTARRTIAPSGFSLDDPIIYGILEDQYGDLWIASQRSLIRVDPSTGAVTKVRLPEGLEVAEFCLGATCETRSGELLFGGKHGVLSVNVLQDVNRIAPQVVLTRVSSFGSTLASSPQLTSGTTLECAHSNDQLSFEFLALHYKNAGRNGYAYRLIGRESEWHYSGTTNSVHYSSLKPGDYVFEVKAANCDGVWSEPVKLRVSILPPLFLRGWFLGLVMVLVGGGSVALHRLRTTRVKREALVREQIRRHEEERVLRQVKDDVHDTFAGIIANIASLTNELKHETRAEQSQADKLSNIARHADSLLQGYLNIQWEYDPDKNSVFELVAQLKSYADILFTQNNIVFSLSGDMDTLAAIKLDTLWRKQLLLIFYEGMNNTARHAQGCRSVNLSVLCNGDLFEMCLDDDGCGLQGSPGRTNGIEHMAERARMIGGSLVIEQLQERGMKVCFRGKLLRGGV